VPGITVIPGKYRTGDNQKEDGEKPESGRYQHYIPQEFLLMTVIIFIDFILGYAFSANNK